MAEGKEQRCFMCQKKNKEGKKSTTERNVTGTDCTFCVMGM
jgi:hypothetical protein